MKRGSSPSILLLRISEFIAEDIFPATIISSDSIKDNTYTWTLNKDDVFKEIDIDFSYKQDKVYGIIMLSIIGVAVLATLIYIGNYLWKNYKI